MLRGDVAPLPLQGIRVIEFASALYGGLTGQLLGDYGADVVKVEPLGGDFFRMARYRPIGDSTRWLGVNRSKRSIVLNLKSPRGKDIAGRLVKGADVVFHNMRKKAAEALGLDYPTLAALNPRLIYLGLYGYGESGPLANWASGDFYVQAMTGVVASQGAAGAPPYLAGIPIADQSGAFLGVMGILLALRARDMHGFGQEVSTSLLDAAIAMQSSQMTHYLVDGRLVGKGGRGWAGAFPMGAYSAKDGDVVLYFSEEQWATVGYPCERVMLKGPYGSS